MIKFLRFLPFVLCMLQPFASGPALSSTHEENVTIDLSDPEWALQPAEFREEDARPRGSLMAEYCKQIQTTDGRTLTILDLKEYFPVRSPVQEKPLPRHLEEMHLFLERAQMHIELNHHDLITNYKDYGATIPLFALFRYMVHSMYHDSRRSWWCFRRSVYTLPNQEEYNELLRRYLTFYAYEKDDSNLFSIVVYGTLMKRPTICGRTFCKGHRKKPTSILKGPSKMLAVFEENYRAWREGRVSYEKNEAALIRTQPNTCWQRTKHFSLLGLPRFFVNPQLNVSLLLNVWPMWEAQRTRLFESTTKRLIRLVSDTPAGLLKMALSKAVIKDDRWIQPQRVDLKDLAFDMIDEMKVERMALDHLYAYSFLVGGGSSLIASLITYTITEENGYLIGKTLLGVGLYGVLSWATSFNFVRL